MCFNVFIPHVTSIILLPCLRKIYDCIAQGKTIQRDMNRWAVGQRFDLVYCYSNTLNTIFVSMFFASGMPILLFTCALTLFL
jgi:hypothetical protein